jgi:oxaloacetate decarboxylase (Na+ extruding) subunit alpha
VEEKTLDLDKLRELIRIFEASGLSEIEIQEEDGRRIALKKPAAHHPAHAPLSLMAPPVAHAAAAPASASGAPGAAPQPVEPEEEYLHTIDSPMVGTFYGAPAPGEPSFVNVGDTVEENQTVCIVEAMKLMNEVTAKEACVIEKALVENGEPVEFGQPLFAVRPLTRP